MKEKSKRCGNQGRESHEEKENFWEKNLRKRKLLRWGGGKKRTDKRGIRERGE